MLDRIKEVLELGDEMASAATSFTSQQGYDQFIRARYKFRSAVKCLCDSYQETKD